MLHHEFEDKDIMTGLEQSGYGSLQPSILPEKLTELCEKDPVLAQCAEGMFTYVNRYAHDVYSMIIEQMELAEKREKGEDTQEDTKMLAETDERRHHLHNALIDSINLLSRELGKRGLDNEWMHDFAHEGRAGYARFALLTFYRLHVKM